MTTKDLAPLGKITDFFRIDTKMFASNSSEVFKVTQVENGKVFFLCLLKEKFNLISDAKEISEFLLRLEKIKSYSEAFSNLTNFAVDKDGKGYGVLGISSISSMFTGNLDYKEAYRRFVFILKFLVKMHSDGVIFGDISNDSFGMDKEGNIRPIACLGEYPKKFKITDEGNHYRLPNEDEETSFTSDVYRFAILSYKIFSKDEDVIPFDTNGEYIPLSRKDEKIPDYIDTALKNSLSKNPDDRFLNAGILYKFIRDGQNNMLAVTSNAMSPSNEELSKVRSSNDLAIRKENDGKKNKNIIFIFIIVFFLLAFLFVCSGKEEKTRSVNLPSNNPSDVRKRMVEQEIKLNKIYDSEDPVIYATIIRMASQSVYPEERKLVEKYLINRFLNLKYERVAKVLSQMFSEIFNNEIPSYYEDLLLTLENNYPIEKRITLFKSLLKKNKTLIVTLSLALSFDTNDFENYKSIFKELIEKDFQLEIERRSFFALAIAEPISWKYDAEMMNKEFYKLDDEDLVWLLPIFVKRGDEHLGELLKVITDKNLLDKSQTTFLKLIEELQPPTAIKAVLFNASASKISSEDVGIILKWMNPARERIFNSMLLVSKDDKSLRRDIFDSMLSIAIENKTTKDFIKYINENEWDNRGDLALLIPYLNNSEIFNEKEIMEVLKNSIIKLDESQKRKILIMLLEKSSLPIKKIIFKNFYETLGVGTLVNFLSFDDKEIKKLAIQGLKDSEVDDVFVSNLILEKYEAEEDPEIKNIYKTTFWFIRGREL